MAELHDISLHRKLADMQKQLEEKLKSGGGGTYDGDMEHRVTALETRLDTILPTLATKGDIGDLKAEFKGWTLTTVLTLVGTMLAGFVGLGSMLAKQTPPQPAAQQPIIINVPPAQMSQPASSK